LKVHSSNARRRVRSSGAFRPSTNTAVTVASASAADLRLRGAQRFHFMSQNITATSYQVALSSSRRIDMGKPLSASKASPLRIATVSAARKLSASALVVNVLV
jgi:hypothetical protein